MSDHSKKSGNSAIAKSDEWTSFKMVQAVPEQSISKVFRKREALQALVAEQILLATNRTYAPMKSRWITEIDGNVRRVMVPKKIKKWWVELPNGKIQVSVYVKSKRLELEPGKNAIEINGLPELVSILESIQRTIDLGDFDSLI